MCCQIERQLTMSTVVYLVLLLALRGGYGYANNSNNRLLAVLNASSSTVDVILQINVEGKRTPETTEITPPLSLKDIIRAEINGDWERGRFVLQLASQTRTLQLKQAVYEALWQELQQMRQIYDPLKVLDLYSQLTQQPQMPSALLVQVYQEFVGRSAHLLAAPFHTDSRSASFPKVDSLLQRLTLSTLDYLRDILEAVFNLVLALESSLSVVQRLGNFSGSVTQLTLANLQLLQRTELKSNVDAQAAVHDNLRQLLEMPTFEQEVARNLREEVYEQLPLDEKILYTAQKICIRNMTNHNSYIYECPQTYLICTNERDPKKASYYVQRGNGGANNTLQFAFYSSYWRNRYILMEPSNHSTGDYITKNVYSRDSIFWWQVVQLSGGGVALYDAATAGSILCGGDPNRWDGEERHVYTRSSLEFENYRRECIWKVEDCSDVTK